MRVGSRVRTATDLPGIATGSEGVITELGRMFIAVRFADGRTGYYAPRQLVVVPERGHTPSQDRNGGVGIGADLPRVAPGSHLCFLPTAGEDASRAPAQYLAAGLEAGDLCVVVASVQSQRRLCRAVQHLGYDVDQVKVTGALMMLGTWDYYHRAPRFTAERQLIRLDERLQQLCQSCRHVRLLGETAPVVTRVDPDEWWEYERRVTPILERSGALALCSYAGLGNEPSLRKAAIATHHYLISGGQLSDS